MFDIVDIAVVAGMMLLRIGIPLLVILAIGYGLKRLDRRWEAEARAEQAAQPVAERPAVQPQAPQPVAPASRKPAKRPVAPQPLPFVPPHAINAQQPGLYAQVGLGQGKHCWDVRNCDEATRAACSAPAHPDQSCWQARFNSEGRVPEECVNCDIFQRYPTM